MGATDPNIQDQMVFQHDPNNISPATSSTIGSESTSSESSTCSNSLELADDASSSSSSSPSITKKFGNHGSMFELSDLMATLPIKRGLSKFYQGKSESFTSLTRVMSIEDLMKKEDPYCNNNIRRRKMLKASKSYANGFDASSKPYTRNKLTSFVHNTTRLRPPLLPCQQYQL